MCFNQVSQATGVDKSARSNFRRFEFAGIHLLVEKRFPDTEHRAGALHAYLIRYHGHSFLFAWALCRGEKGKFTLWRRESNRRFHGVSAESDARRPETPELSAFKNARRQSPPFRASAVSDFKRNGSAGGPPWRGWHGILMPERMKEQWMSPPAIPVRSI